MNDWTPTPLDLNLNKGLPFSYSEAAISQISATEVFKSGINNRDEQMCIVCGFRGKSALDHCHIVPRHEGDRWEFLRSHGLIPKRSKSVEHEARNGVTMCKNHHSMFDHYEFYIRWVSEHRYFVLVNHSRSEELDDYHGRAVGLFPDNPRVPFHGAFLDHEMRVRGYWPYLPYYADRPIGLPIQWQRWIVDDAPGGDDGDDNEDDYKVESEDNNRSLTTDLEAGDLNIISCQQQQLPSASLLLFRDPIANPSELEAVMRSSRQQPNWKAAQIEGESWEGTAEANISKYQKIMHPPPENWPELIHGLTGKYPEL